ncbi:dTDP-4-dehydrorhamnose reductase family protein [Acetobacterium carbinolicum]|uniref:dTDP-4-dehydrorhamnose reductase family protein n=1 Tax=Acetobacterium carbinolicum TaxID=52690 RepID=UPI0039C94ACF
MSLIKKKILITGASGMLGKRIIELFSIDQKYEVYGVSRKNKNNDSPDIIMVNIDLMDMEAVEDGLNQIKPEMIIHCAANVNLEDCQKNQNAAYKLHVESTQKLAAYNPGSTKFIYISTDSVFDGRKGNYTEEDKVNPLNYYAESKYLGEKTAISSNSNTLVIRTNIYGFGSSEGHSLVEWAIEQLSSNQSIKGFEDVLFNPVYVGQLAAIIKKLLEEGNITGVLNIGSDQFISKYQFLKKVAKTFDFSDELISSASSDSMSMLIDRPKNTTLNVSKLFTLTGEVLAFEKGLLEMKQNMMDHLYSIR